MATAKQNVPKNSERRIPARKNAGHRSRPSPRDPKPPRPTRDRFEISVHPHEGTYVGKIWHPFSKRTEQLKSLDGTQIVGFIQDCLPSTPAEPPTAQVPLAAERSPVGVLKEVEVRQGERQGPIERVILQPDKSFSVIARLMLPSAPEDSIPFNVPDYSVSLIARRPSRVGQIAEGTVAGALKPGQSEYESRIEMPGLHKGRYVLDAYTRVPLASVAENERISLQVG
jgi:hypothetical protein